MERFALPTAAFLNPDGSNRPEIEQLARQGLALLLDQGLSAGDRLPLPLQAPAVDGSIPEWGMPWSDLLEKLLPLVQGGMNPAHPGYLGHMDPIASTASILGDAIAAQMNNNLLSVEMSPTLSRLEQAVLRQLARQQFGLGPQSGGLLLSGGSLANLQALAVARNHHFPVQAHGLGVLGLRPVLLASEAAHTSLQKAAMLLGLGSEAVLPVATDAQGRMRLEAARQVLADARLLGQQPFCLVATAGTTVTGSIDPLPELAVLAREAGLWFHVDASFGGALAFSDRHRDRLQGIEQADSVTFNPQKWLCVTKTCAALLVRDWAGMTDCFRTAAPYMTEDDDLINLGEVSVQGTRHADILKLWLTLCHFGRQGCGELVDRSLALAACFRRRLEQRPELEAVVEPTLNIFCIRPRRADSATMLDLQRSLQRQGFFLSLPQFQGQRWLKAVLVNPHTTEATLDELFAAIDHFLEPAAAPVRRPSRDIPTL